MLNRGARASLNRREGKRGRPEGGGKGGNRRGGCGDSERRDPPQLWRRRLRLGSPTFSGSSTHRPAPALLRRLLAGTRSRGYQRRERRPPRGNLVGWWRQSSSKKFLLRQNSWRVWVWSGS